MHYFRLRFVPALAAACALSACATTATTKYDALLAGSPELDARPAAAVAPVQTAAAKPHKAPAKAAAAEREIEIVGAPDVEANDPVTIPEELASDSAALDEWPRDHGESHDAFSERYWSYSVQKQLVGSHGVDAFHWEAALDHPRVQAWIRYFDTRGKAWLEGAMARMQTYYPMVAEVTRDEGVFPGIVALAIAESGFNPAAYSRAGAAGMWQFMRATGKLYDLNADFWTDERFDPLKATHSGVEHLRDLYEQFQSWPLAFSAYNAGPHRVTRAIKKAGGNRDFWELSRRRLLPPETRNYTPKIIAITYWLHRYNWQPQTLQAQLETHELNDAAPTGTGAAETAFTALRPVEVPPLTDLTRVATLLEMPAEQIAKFNPVFRIGTTPPQEPSLLWLPTSEALALESMIADGIAPWMTETKQIKVGANQATPQLVQASLGIPASLVAQLNGVSLTHQFKLGETIFVPVGADIPMSSLFYQVQRTVHRVRKGETLSQIAKRYRISVAQLKRANNLKSTRIRVGQRLVIKEKSTASHWAAGHVLPES